MKNNRTGLGRGLDALFATQSYKVKVPAKDEVSSDDTQNSKEKTVETQKNETLSVHSANDGMQKKEEGDRVTLISIDDIKPNSAQPRKHFDAEKISELADSIREHGIIQPLIIRKAGNFYEIVAGERRWRAAREAGIKEIPAIVRALSDEENMLIAIIENLQREDLNPIEEAEGLSAMIQTYGLTQSEVSKSVSKSRPYITNALRLLNLPESVRSFVAAGKLSAGHARAILSCEKEEEQEVLAKKVIQEGLSVRETEKLAMAVTMKTKAHPAKKVKDSAIRSVEEELREKFSTKVSIDPKRKGGTVSFTYYNVEELNRLIELFRHSAV